MLAFFEGSLNLHFTNISKLPKLRLITLIILLLALGTSEMCGQLVINEVVAGNSQYNDNFGQTPDWIEFKNIGDEEIDLDDYYLSDDPANLFMWNLPDVDLDAEDLVVIFGQADSTDQFHFSFGIGLNGEDIFLSHVDVGLIQNLPIPNLRQNHSYGIPQGEADYRFFNAPTPNANNTTPNFLGYLPSPTPSHAAGQYDSPFELILFPPFNGGEIHYTLDGSTPHESSPVFENQLVIDSLHVVKSAFFQDDWLPSTTVSTSYFVDVQHSLPIISLSCANDSLFDPILGLYMDGPNIEEEWPYFGANYWAEREIPVSFEYFENGDLKFSQDVGLQIHGGKSSRTKPQRPLRLTARSEYGPDFMNYAFFDNKPGVNKFRHLVLRNSGADFLKSNFRDGYWHQVALEEKLDFEAFGFQPSVVYINGAYWGIMNIREKASEFYCSENSQANPDSVIIGQIENEPFVGDTIHYFNLTEFIFANDMSLESNFAYVESLIDVQSYQDYFAFEIFAGNPDWPANNIKFWKPSADSGKWRFILFDLDTTMGLTNWLTSDWDMFDWVFNEKHEALNSRVFISLLDNDEFKRQFLNRLADLMNTKLSTESLHTHLSNVIATFEPEIKQHYALWGGHMSVWRDHTEIRIPQFLEGRQAHVQNQVVNHFGFDQKVELTFSCFPPEAGLIQINSLDAQNYFEGVYFAGNALDLAVHPHADFEFDHWAFSEHWVDLPYDVSIQQNFRASGTLTAVFKDRNQQSLYTIDNSGEDSSFQLVYQSEERTQSRILVTNNSGKVVLERFKYMEEGKNFFTLDLSEMSAGIYIVQVISDNNQEVLTLSLP